MNANIPVNVPSVSVPWQTPTAGALVGSVLSMLVTAPAASVGIPPMVTTPLVTTFSTWLAHWLHTKLGTPE